MTTGLELVGIRAGYGRVEVLHGVDVAFPAGAVTALVGHNGAGKSTLLRCAAGTVRPRQGHVQWDGAEVTRWSPHRRAGAGLTFVPDELNVFSTLTVEENLMLFGRPQPIDEIVDTVTETFPELRPHLLQRAGTLSGGERQMLALARALVRPSRVLLLDEVSRGLSAGVTARFYERLHRLVTAELVVVVCEQFLDTSLANADVVYVMRRGRVSFVGEPAELAELAELARVTGGT